MFVNLEKKFIYLRPPKVASTTLIDFFWQAELADSVLYDNWRVSSNCIGKVWKKGFDTIRRNSHSNIHPKAHEVFEMLENENNSFDNYRIVTSIRNPYIHALSHYLFQNKMVRQRYKRKENFRYFLNNPIRFLAQNFFSMHSKLNFKIFLKYVYKPYTKWFLVDGKNVVTDYIRVESLENDLEDFCKKVDLPYTFPEKKNVNKAHDNSLYSKYFDEEVKGLIENYYPEIIKKFNYKCPNF